MQRRKFSREFKCEAVRLVRERGVSLMQAAGDLDRHETVLRTWVRAQYADPVSAFPGNGQRKPEQAEIERDILKSRGLLCEGLTVRFEFIAKHRGTWPVAWLCEALGTLRSGFHA
jgi:transposase-like protein